MRYGLSSPSSDQGSAKLAIWIPTIAFHFHPIALPEAIDASVQLFVGTYDPELLLGTFFLPATYIDR